jgi:hypothetical protein
VERPPEAQRSVTRCSLVMRSCDFGAAALAAFRIRMRRVLSSHQPTRRRHLPAARQRQLDRGQTHPRRRPPHRHQRQPRRLRPNRPHRPAAPTAPTAPTAPRLCAADPIPAHVAASAAGPHLDERKLPFWGSSTVVARKAPPAPLPAASGA